MYSQLFPHQFCWTLHSRHVHCNIHIFDNRHKLKAEVEDLSNSILLNITNVSLSGKGTPIVGFCPPVPPSPRTPLSKLHLWERNTIYMINSVYEGPTLLNFGVGEATWKCPSLLKSFVRNYKSINLRWSYSWPSLVVEWMQDPFSRPFLGQNNSQSLF